MSTGGEVSAGRGGDLDPNDFFVEPFWCTRALLAEERFEGPICDPACGSGRIVECCRAAGYEAYGEDLIDRAESRYGVGDFFQSWGMRRNIVSNPPYGLAAAFAYHALEVTTHKVALLVQAKFLYSQARYRLFTGTPVSCIYHFSRRPSMPPGDLLLAGKIKPTGGKMDFCWVVFSHGHVGPPTTRWLLPAGED